MGEAGDFSARMYTGGRNQPLHWQPLPWFAGVVEARGRFTGHYDQDWDDQALSGHGASAKVLLVAQRSIHGGQS